MMTVVKKMNDGVAMLLERMKTNPEEFVPNNGSSKWGSLIAAYKDFLEPEDRQALTEGMNKLLQQAFTEKVMQELIDPAEESNVSKLGKIMKKQREAENILTQIHIDAHNKALGQTPIAGVTQTI
jgi:hypothetical protein